MDFKDVVKQLAERVEKLKSSLQTEEATKNALIMPFLQAIGYDVFNPVEVVPEFTCDIGTKKGEKVDYAIMKDGHPVILIECKHWKEDLTLHDNQLLRYFTVSNAKFGILTNGIIYRFYADLEKPNKMDEKPFLEVDFLDLKTAQIEELKKFHKAYFDLDNILSSANELKYMNELKSIIISEFSTPSPEFVKLIAKKVYDGQFTAKILDQFTGLVKRSISNHINDVISDRLKTALKAETEEKKQEKETVQVTMQLPEGVIYMSEDGSIVTTQEEIEAFYIVRSIVRQHIGSDRITYRDAHSYFAIFIDDNNRKTVCRLYFNSPTNKRIAFLNDDKKEVMYKIQSLDEIYNYSEQLISIAKKYL
jgi:hypothetical protein